MAASRPVLGVLLLALLCAPSSSTEASSPIKHIVVLMMENRSFDHMLGWLTMDYSPKIDGLLSGQTCPRDPTDPSKGALPLTRDGYDVGPDDPLHGFDDTQKQIDSFHMDGFVANAIEHHHNETNPISMFDKHSAPIINTLAMEFAVFDRWFCSVPGPTDPNRAYAMSGTSHGRVENFDGTLWPQQSYFDYLRVNNRSFAAYYQDDPWAVWYYEDTNKPINSKHLHTLDEHFYTAAAEGKLADFVWLQPRSTTHGSHVPTWQHPDASVTAGEDLIKKVYEALRNGPQWNETLFLITYDEHGGFYDHVPTPNKDVPNPDGLIAPNGFKFDRLGIRIPTVAVSPWIERGTIVSDPFPGEQPTPSSAYDATSIMATVNKLLGVKAAPLSKRAAWANTFVGLTTQRRTPRTDCPETLPAVRQATAEDVAAQRAKPVNDQLEAQFAFYCLRNHAHDAECISRAKATLVNQGLASDWIVEQVAVHRNRLRVLEEQLAMNEL